MDLFYCKTTTGVLLYVGLTLVIIVPLLSVAVLIFCKKRATKAKGEHLKQFSHVNSHKLCAVCTQLVHF